MRGSRAVTLNGPLVSRLDRLVDGGVFPNRSQAIEAAVVEKLERIGKRLGNASPEELATVIEGLTEIVGG
jgi:Arc/MetJ-type ribon-helix-helix transcriptional regulator